MSLFQLTLPLIQLLSQQVSFQSMVLGEAPATQLPNLQSQVLALIVLHSAQIRCLTSGNVFFAGL